MSIRRWRIWRRRFSTAGESKPWNTGLENLEDDLQHLQWQTPIQVRYTYASLLKRCGNAAALSQGKKVHDHIVKNGLGKDGFIGDLLVQMYGKCGSLQDAISVFNDLPRKTVFSWNFLIGAYAKGRHGRKAIELFKQMDSEGIQPNAFTLACVLGACSDLKDLEQGKAIHARIKCGEFPSGIAVETVLVKMYARCGRLEDARAVFDGIQSKDVICWNSMIAAYAQHGHKAEARKLYEEMEAQGLVANDTTFAGIIGACNSLEEGKTLHSRVIVRGLQSSTIVQNALVSMYARCQRVDVAETVFRKIEAKSVVSWNAMIAACTQNGQPEKALRLYWQMDLEANEVTFASVLNACSNPDRVKADAFGCLEDGKKIHSRIKGTQFESNVTVATALMTMYSRCAQVDVARKIFDNMQQKNVVSWNAMLGAYAQNGREQEGLELYHRMVAENVQPDEVTVVTSLGICGALRRLELGKKIHNLSISSGYESTIRVQNALIGMYGKCGELRTALEVFNKIKSQDVVSWTTLIVAHTQHGYDREAIQLYKEMESRGVEPDSVTFTSILSACSVVQDMEMGQALHARFQEKKFLGPSDVVVAGLINMYVKCGRLDLSRELFHNCEEKTLVIWNAMISAYEQEGYSRAALDIYHQMDSDPDEATFSSVLSACAELKALEEGEEVHIQVIAAGTKSAIVHNALMNMYISCGRMNVAKKVFNRMERRDLVSWTVLISGYVQNSEPKKALELYKKMILEGIQPNEITMLSVIAACSALESLWEGIVIHAVSNVNFFSSDAVQAALIAMYAKCQRLDVARRVFQQVRHLEASVNCWNAMVAAHTQLGYPEKAIELYVRMSLEGIKPNEGSFAVVLNACSAAEDLLVGHSIHAQIRASTFINNLNLKTALVHMYAKCGRVEAAWDIFEHIEEPDVVAWNAMMAAFAQNGYGRHALELYDRMLQKEVEPDTYTITNVLSVCSNLRMLERGKSIHSRALSRNPELGVAVDCALFNLYAKCGKLTAATSLFSTMKVKNIVCWHGIIAAHAHHGRAGETLWYYRLLNLEGYRALEPTFLCVFLACGHAGLLDEGRWYFQSMIEDGMVPTCDHYVCMVNLMARLGRLVDAEDLLDNMPFEPNSAAWTSLLGACKTHGDIRLAQRAADEAMELDQDDSAPYVLLSNTFTVAS